MKYFDILKMLYPNYPRQMALPRRFDIYSFNGFEDTIKKYLNVKGKRIFTTLYNYSFQNPNNVFIDKLFFDFDSDIEFNRKEKIKTNPFENTKKLFNYVRLKNLKSLFVFSGGGFHTYIFTKNGNKLKNPKNALRNAQTSILNQAGLMIEHKGFKYPLVDKKIIGDIARVVTVPGTMNWKRNRWANFLGVKDFEKGFDFIKERAKNNRYGVFKIIGEELIDLKNYDTELFEFKTLSIDEEETKEIEKSKILSNVPPCIAHLLLEIRELEHSWRERFIIITYFIGEGFNKREIENILQKFLPPKKFHHCIKVEHQLDSIYRRKIIPLGCNAMKREGYCVKTCNRRWLDE